MSTSTTVVPVVSASGANVLNLLQRLVGLEPEEVAPSLWAAAAFAAGLGSYTILKPLRDAIGLQRGADALPWLFTATLIAMAIAAPAYAALADRLRGRSLVVRVWYLVALTQVLFLLLFVANIFPQGLYVCFFVWVSVFNFIVVSALWSWLTTVRAGVRAIHTLGPIAFGGSAAALLGPLLARLVASRGDPLWLLLVSASLLVIGAWATARVEHGQGKTGALDPDDLQSAAPASPSHPRSSAGIDHATPQRTPAVALRPWATLFSSRELLFIAAYTGVVATLSTFVYAEQGRIVERLGESMAQRTVALADVDLVANLVAIGLQLFAASRILRALDAGRSLSLVPLAGIPVGLALLALPSSGVLAIFEGSRRGLNHGLGRPAKESLYSGMDDDARYGARSLIETLVVRLSDATAIWLHAGMGLWLGRDAGLYTLIPLSLLACALAVRASPTPRSSRGIAMSEVDSDSP